MLYGIGCDLCSLSHLEKSLSSAHAAAFVRRVYGPAEQAALGLLEASPAPLNAHRLASAAADFAMQPRETYVNCEDGINEYSVFAHCKQGHVTLHLYPDLGFVTIDVFTCFKDADPDGLARFLRHYFDPDKSKITYLERGDFGSESDMKPRRKSNIKTVRRARTIGNKLSKLIMKPRSM